MVAIMNERRKDNSAVASFPAKATRAAVAERMAGRCSAIVAGVFFTARAQPSYARSPITGTSARPAGGGGRVSVWFCRSVMIEDTVEDSDAVSMTIGATVRSTPKMPIIQADHALP